MSLLLLLRRSAHRSGQKPQMLTRGDDDTMVRLRREDEELVALLIAIGD